MTVRSVLRREGSAGSGADARAQTMQRGCAHTVLRQAHPSTPSLTVDDDLMMTFYYTLFFTLVFLQCHFSYSATNVFIVGIRFCLLI